METLFAKQDRLLALTSTGIVRKLIEQINWDAQLIAIKGARGVGKTTLMLQYIKLNYPQYSREVLYCSLDAVYFSNHSLLDLTDKFYKNGGKHLFLDEVHKYPNWSREIKEIYDGIELPVRATKFSAGHDIKIPFKKTIIIKTTLPAVVPLYFIIVYALISLTQIYVLTHKL